MTVGHHVGILVEDNLRGSSTYGQRWYYAGGPEHGYELFGEGYGSLISHSGKDSRQERGKEWGGSVTLVDDDSPVGPALRSFDKAEQEMAKTDVRYGLVPLGPGSGNSNSWARELLERTGLLPELKRKLDGGPFGLGRKWIPWSPGFANDPWGDKGRVMK